MFQTEPILWLQAMQSDSLTFFMRAVSLIVDDTVFLVLGLVIFFGFDHRKGYTVLFTLLWVALLTAASKACLALPRPSDVDTRVLLLETGVPNSTPFFAQGAASLFGLPSSDVISAVRGMHSPDFGLPSGHCSSTVAFWGTLAYLIRKKWIFGTAICLSLIMPFSRMYLGRHFLGDTIGGLMLGAIALLCLVTVMRRLHKTPPSPTTSLRSTALRALVLIVLPVLPLFFTPTRPFAATLLAFGLIFFATGNLRVYDGNRTLLSRALLTAFAIALVGILQTVLAGILPKSIAYGLVIVSVFGTTGIAMGLLAARNQLKQSS